MGSRGASSSSRGGYQLTGTAAAVTDGGKTKTWNDAYGNYYYLENGNVYMEKHSYMTAYDLSRGWVPVNGAVGTDKYLAPGSKDYDKMSKSYYAQKAAETAKIKAKAEKQASNWKDKGYGGKSMKPYELYKLATKQYGVKMTYLKYQSKGVEGIMKEASDNKAAYEALKPYFNPRVSSAGKLYWSSYAS